MIKLKIKKKTMAIPNAGKDAGEVGTFVHIWRNVQLESPLGKLFSAVIYKMKTENNAVTPQLPCLGIYPRERTFVSTGKPIYDNSLIPSSPKLKQYRWSSAEVEG